MARRSRRINQSRRWVGALVAGLLAVVGVGVLVPASADSCHVVPPTIAANGSIDVTVSLQAFVDGVPDGSCIRFAANGRYWVEGGLLIHERYDLRFRGMGAEMFAKHPGPDLIKGYRQHVRISHSTKIRFRDFTITGANASGQYDQKHEGEHGVSIMASDDVRLIDLTITRTYGDGIYFSGEPAEPGSGEQELPASNVVVKATVPGKGGSFFLDVIGRHGLGVIHADTVTVDGIDVGHVARSMLDLEADREDEYVRNLTVKNSEFLYAPLNFVAMGGRGIRDGIVIENNHLSGMSMHQKIGDPVNGPMDRFHISFIGNVSDFPHYGAPPFVVNGVKSFVAVGNVQPFGGDQGAFSISSSCDILAKDNVFVGAGGLFSGDLSCRVVDGGGNQL